MKSILIFLLLVLFACESNNELDERELNPPIDFLALLQEHNKAARDSTETIDALQGNWLLIYRFCCGEGETSYVEKINDNIILSVDSLSYQFTEKQEIVQEGTWELVQEDIESYGMRTKPRIQETDGRIFIEDSLLIFDLAYIDAYRHYFKRID